MTTFVLWCFVFVVTHQLIQAIAYSCGWVPKSYNRNAYVVYVVVYTILLVLTGLVVWGQL